MTEDAASGGRSAVTTVVSRRINPRQHEAFNEWTRNGPAYAHRFDGFLKGGWLRENSNSTLTHVLYRFETHDHLKAWLESEARLTWLAQNTDFAAVATTRQLTGIEVWFDTGNIREPGTPNASPVPRWKQTTVVWLGFFPVSLVLNYLLGPHLVEWSILARTLLVTTLCTPFMTYAVLPFLTTRLSFWLTQQNIQSSGNRFSLRKASTVTGSTSITESAAGRLSGQD